MGDKVSKSESSENGAVNSNVTVNENASVFPLDIHILIYVIAVILCLRSLFHMSKGYRRYVKRDINRSKSVATINDV